MEKSASRKCLWIADVPSWSSPRRRETCSGESRYHTGHKRPACEPFSLPTMIPCEFMLCSVCRTLVVLSYTSVCMRFASFASILMMTLNSRLHISGTSTWLYVSTWMITRPGAFHLEDQTMIAMEILELWSNLDPSQLLTCEVGSSPATPPPWWNQLCRRHLLHSRL